MQVANVFLKYILNECSVLFKKARFDNHMYCYAHCLYINIYINSLHIFYYFTYKLGNAMGYVRMIRSGGLHSCSNASVFLPMLDENNIFEQLCNENNLSRTVCEAAHVLEQDIRNLACNFAEGSEYFKVHIFII